MFGLIKMDRHTLTRLLLPFKKIHWSLVSVVTLRAFSLGGPVTVWLLHSQGADGFKTVAPNQLKKNWDQRPSAQKRCLYYKSCGKLDLLYFIQMFRMVFKT